MFWSMEELFYSEAEIEYFRSSIKKQSGDIEAGKRVIAAYQNRGMCLLTLGVVNNDAEMVQQASDDFNRVILQPGVSRTLPVPFI